MPLTHAMILAAGRGERMRPLTDHTPKPLLPVAGKPLIVYHLEKLKAAGIQQVVINHAWLGEQFAPLLGDGRQFGLSIHYSAESQALETAGGIVQALPLLQKNNPSQQFLLINGDVYCEWAFTDMLLAGQQLAHLYMVPNPEHHPTGDFALCGEQLSLDGQSTVTYSGVGVYRCEPFTHLLHGKRPLAPLLKQQIAAGKITGQRMLGYWCDVGTPARLSALENRLRNK